MFRQLRLDPSCPSRFSSFAQLKLEKHFLKPVHEMFRYPIAGRKYETFFEFTIANNLLSVINGLSSLCYKERNAHGDSGHRFCKVLLDHYPWQDEPSMTLTPIDWARLLYRTYRNPLAHALGIDRKGNRVKFLRIRTQTRGRVRGHSERELETIETAMARPSWSATLEQDSTRTVLHLEGLYWGVRKLTENISSAAGCMMYADNYLRKRPNW